MKKDKLYLLFIARQSYWEAKTEVPFVHFWHYLYPYILSALAILGLVFIAKNDLVTLLQQHHFLGVLSLYQLAMLVTHLLFPLGLIYENYHTKKSQTQETFYLFFNTPYQSFRQLLLLKNTILSLPALALSLFFQPLILVLILGLAHFTSVCYLFAHSKTRSNPHSDLPLRISSFYLFSLIDMTSCLKILSLPLLSLLVFFSAYLYYPDLLQIDLRHQLAVFVSGLFLASFLYANKGLSYFFLGLTKELTYLKAMGLPVATFLIKQLLFLWSLTLFPAFLLLAYFLIRLDFAKEVVVLLLFSFTLGFLLNESVQLLNALLLKDKSFQTVKELSNYRLPLRQYLFFWLLRLSLLLPILISTGLDKRLTMTFITLVSFIILVIFMVIFHIVIKTYGYRTKRSYH